MAKFIDRTGTELNGILFLKRAYKNDKAVTWLCRCTCGNEFITRFEHIASGRKCPKCGRKNQSRLISKHNDYKNPLYSVWVSMRQRCNNPKSQEYKNYGGRGISVCLDWDSDYLVFKKWACENGYDKGLTIDRINNDGNYEPDNCRWVTNKTQSLNKRSNHLITFDGKTLPITTMAKLYGFKPTDIERRILKGWTPERALTTPVKRLK